MMAQTMWRLVAKLLFKASLPLILLVGALSYGLYMQGGDPGAVLRSVAGNAMKSVTSAARNATNSVTGSLEGSLDTLKPGDVVEGGKAISEFYTWVDENGVTHYSSEPPADRSTDTVTVDANTNIIVSLPSGQPHDNQDTNFDATGNPDGAGAPGTGHPQTVMPDGGRLPGMAGIVLPDGVNPQSLVELLQSRQR